MYRIALCDDSLEFISYLENMVLQCGLEQEDVEFYEYESGEAFLERKEKEVDVLFLDIQMDGIDGNKTAELLRKDNHRVLLVFCTGITFPTPETFRFDVFRYLMKQNPEEQLKKDLKEIITELTRRKAQFCLPVVVNKEVTKVNAGDIAYISIIRRGCKVWIVDRRTNEVVDNGVFAGTKLSDIYEKLRYYGFEYAHSSYIVNLNYVRSIKKGEVELENGTNLCMSRSRTKKFRERFGEYLSDIRF